MILQSRMNRLHKEFNRGQTKTEWVLILASIATIVFVTYQTMGSTIGTLARSVASFL
jgi:hypothetical protein